MGNAVSAGSGSGAGSRNVSVAVVRDEDFIAPSSSASSAGVGGGGGGGIGGAVGGPSSSALRRQLESHPVLGGYRVECPLAPGSGRVSRTYRVRHHGGGSGKEAVAVLKVMMVEVEEVPPPTSSTSTSPPSLSEQQSAPAAGGGGVIDDDDDDDDDGLSGARRELERIRRVAMREDGDDREEIDDDDERSNARRRKPMSHVAPFLAWFVGEPTAAASGAGAGSNRTVLRPAFLLRPHLYTTLSDRLASRPWLSGVEKLWIIHQLLKSLQELHDSGVVHGSVTTENVGLTSYSHVVLTDLSSCYKAARLADDDPSEYLLHFQLQHHSATHHHGGTTAATKRSEKRCYLAPERFYTPSAEAAVAEDQPPGKEGETAGGDGDGAPGTSEEGRKVQRRELTPAMDIFSTGCVLVELLLNGERCFDLGDLIEYRRSSGSKGGGGGEIPASLQQKLAKIESSHLRAACRHMLSLDPSQRLSASEYWQRLEASGQIPTSFGYLTDLLERVHSDIPSPDARVAVMAAHYGRVLHETVGERDVAGQAYLDKVLGREMLALERGEDVGDLAASEREGTVPDETATPIAASSSSNAGVDDLLAETEALLRQLESFDLNDTTAGDETTTTGVHDGDPSPAKSSADAAVEGEKVDRSQLCKSSLLIFLQLLLSTIRHVQRPASKLVALQLIQRLARFSSDEARLQRIVPVAVALLQDQDPLVRSAVLRTLTYTLSIIESFSPFDAQVFPQYIFKRIAHLISDPSLVVRITFAQSLAVLAETARRFLDIRHAVRLYEAVESGTGSTTPADDRARSERDGNVFTDDLTKLLDATTAEHSSAKAKTSKYRIGGNYPKGADNALVAAGKTLINSTYSSELAGLRETVSRWVVHITTDQSDHSALPKRSLMSNLGRLCHFFGLEGVMSFILPQIVAFLNDRKNWELRMSLFGALPSVCHMIGRAATEEFVLPCVEIGLVDVEECVIARALSCVTSLVEMNLLSRAVLLGETTPSSSSATATGSSDGPRPQQQSMGVLHRYRVLLVHPSEDIRHEAIKTFSTVGKVVNSLVRDVYFLPLVRPVLRFEPPVSKLCSEHGLRLCIKKPWTRERFSEEFAKCPVRGDALGTDGAWTSIGIQVREETGAVETTAPSPVRKSAAFEHGEVNKQEDPLIGQMREYLRMLVRHTYQSPTQELRQNNSSILSTRSEISAGIEGSVKLAQSIMFPREDIRLSRVHESLPMWYSSLRDSAEIQNSTVTEASAIRSVSALGHVYGLSIMGPAEGTAAENIVGIATDDSQQGGTAEETEKVLHAPDSKVLEAAFTGQWGAETMVNPDVVDTSLLVTKLKALNVPPLPPNFGELEVPRTIPATAPPPPSSRGGPSKESSASDSWRPRINALVASSSTANGHSAPVVRLAVSADNSFFTSASYDGTCRVWETPKVEESAGILESSLVYSGHLEAKPARVNDLAMIESSHSLVSGSSDGSVHVWRVDMLSSSGKPHSQQQNVSGGPRRDRSKAVGTSLIRTVEPNEGEVLAVSHFNTLSASVVTFGTQMGRVHSWDLRCAREPFRLSHGPELGYLTSVVLGNDRQWVVTGTSRGYIALWDVRFQQAVKLWLHSRQAPISRLATSVVTPHQGWSSRTSSEGVRPFIFAACGENECAMFDAVSGSCRECFRTITGDRRELNSHVEDPPALSDIPISSRRGGNSLNLLQVPQTSFNYVPPASSINCMVGSIGVENQCFLITGGSDSRIRFWDFSTPSKCYIASGLSQTQLRPSFERIDFDKQKRLMLCRQPLVSGLRDSNKLFQGLRKPDLQHTDAIQDLKMIDDALVSCSRDCTVKVWR